MRRTLAVGILAVVTAPGAHAQTIAPAGGPTPNLVSNIERPLRYRPDGHAFVIENGGEFFNRPLYGGNTAFRVDAGDVPEFLLYLPGRGGNLRLGLHTPAGTRWLHEAGSIVARYLPGEMAYEIRDPLLGDGGALHVAAVPTHDVDGLIVRFDASRVPAGMTVVFGFGGVSGQRGRRDGDIGTEQVPIGEYFQLRPEVCRADQAEVFSDRFLVRGKSAEILGLVPAGTTLGVGSSHAWGRLFDLLESQNDDAPDPVVVGEFALHAGTPAFLALQRLVDAGKAPADLPVYRDVNAPAPGGVLPAGPLVRGPIRADEVEAAFVSARQHYANLRGQIRVATPDATIDAAVAALNIAADAVWDEPQQGIMHGAIAWRTRLLGWRGPYAMDALGWHERARAHFRYWAAKQNTDPIPDSFPPPEEETNLARSRRALHSNGNMAMSHYDMNLVAIDALFRHLRWTGDLAFAREMWPVIERHLAWERRLFRREFATDSGDVLPLYEAYAAIWASDDLQYHGGGTAHASAYNVFHNREAARLARLLGHDAAPYEREADLIARGMRKLLWLPEVGTFAEFKDLLGLQLVHPSAALWSVYHVIDSEVATPSEARAMADYVAHRLPRIPVRGPGVPAGEFAVHATTDWMPYTWSINNVVMGENIHTALAWWQAGLPEEAFVLTKGSLLASMYMGICPGNVGSMNTFDVYRRESQRDFADGSGVLARAIVEGLFGIRPDALGGELVVAPGFPSAWARASIETPDVAVRYERRAAREWLRVEPRSDAVKALRVSARWDGREPATRRAIDGGFEFEWAVQRRPDVSKHQPRPVAIPPPALDISGALDPVDLAPQFNDRVTEIFRPGKYRSPRSPFVSLALPAQGIGAWAGHVNAMAEIDDTGLRAAAAAHAGVLVLPSGLRFATPGPGDAPNIVFVSQWDNYPREATVPLAGRARRIHLLMAGSTNAMQSRLDNGEVVATYTDGGTTRLALRNPETWWPIEQDYFIDDFQFRVDAPLPARVDLRTGAVRVLDHETFKGRGGVVPGGAATILVLDLDPGRELKSLTVRALANEVVVGLMAATL
ncbi:MAG: DUF4450 domain-containing protein, partial [Opitutaceae bacterium]|nr:DUF4450 domain-containing protein [Opitutaceae bacterium]